MAGICSLADVKGEKNLKKIGIASKVQAPNNNNNNNNNQQDKHGRQEKYTTRRVLDGMELREINKREDMVPI